jgi:putative membrane protein
MPEFPVKIPKEETLMRRKTLSTSYFSIVVVVASGLGLIGTARAQTGVADNPHLRASSSPQASASKLTDKDRKFIQEAANGGVAEVVDGKVAEERGQSAEVKKIGARMVADHSKANNELAELAKKKGLGIDLNKGKPRNFSQDRFDGQYLVTMENDHKTDIGAFEKEASSGDDADIKAWAAKTLPTLKAHLAMVREAMKKKK